MLLATTTPDGIVPGTAPTVQNALGINGGAFDINAACSGFVYGLVTAAGLIAMGAGPILLIGSETLSKITDMDDRAIAIIVGDGAGAVVVQPVEGPGQLLSWNLNSDGSLRHLLYCEHGGTLYMDGKEVFRKAVRVVVESAERAMADAGPRARTTSRCSCRIRPTCASSWRPASGWAFPKSAPWSSSTATATPPPPPFPSPCTTPSATTGCTTATTSSSPVSAGA